MTAPRPTPLSLAGATEFVATAFLLIAVVGSGIAAEQLAGASRGLALLANALATAGALFALIAALGPVSGAHMNPAVTLTSLFTGGCDGRTATVYIAAQVAGAVVGVWIAHIMFELPVLQTSAHARTGIGQWTAEAVATVGLLGTIWGCQRHGTPTTAAAVAVYIGGAYWFTASTSFANPAVTIARALTDTFAGIRPVDVPGFVLAQLAAAAVAILLLRRLRRAV